MSKQDRSPKNILRLAMIHIQRFKHRIEIAHRGFTGIRLVECERYLKLWESIRDKGTWEKLTEAERNEVADAIFSGE